MEVCSDDAIAKFTLNDTILTDQYDLHLDYDYKDKVILDIGAEVGTSAEFFLNRGAKFVWCVEGDQRLVNLGNSNIVRHYLGRAQMLPAMWIKTPWDFEQLFCMYGWEGPQKVNLIKIDIEGWECCMLSMNEDILAAQQEFIIDIHGKHLTKLIGAKLVKCGYKLLDDTCGDTIHAVKIVEPVKKTFTVVGEI